MFFRKKAKTKYLSEDESMLYKELYEEDIRNKEIMEPLREQAVSIASLARDLEELKKNKHENLY